MCACQSCSSYSLKAHSVLVGFELDCQALDFSLVEHICSVVSFIGLDA
jgi:hypothetical protein